MVDLNLAIFVKESSLCHLKVMYLAQFNILDNTFIPVNQESNSKDIKVSSSIGIVQFQII